MNLFLCNKCVLSIFFVLGVKESKYAMTEFYENLSYTTLSGADNFNFEAISDLTSGLSFSIKKVYPS